MTVAVLKVAIKELEAKVIKVEEEINTKLTTEIKHLEMMSLSISIDTKRDLYILPMSNGSLVTMDLSGGVIDKIKLIPKPLYGAAYCETDFYVTSSNNPPQVYLINPNIKHNVASFSPNTTFTHPFNINSCQFRSAGAIKPAIVVSDFNSHCIKVLDMSGQLLHTYGKEGNAGQILTN